VLDDQEQLRRFEALVHTSPDFIAVAGMDGKIEFLNAAGRALVGIAAEVDLAETSIADYLTEEALAASFEVEQPAVLRDGFWTGESTLRDWRDDSSIPVMVTSFRMLDPRTKEPVAMATIQRDLRELRMASAEAAGATRALQRGEELQRALLLHMSDLVLLVDEDLNLVYASPSASRILGHEEGSQLGRPLLELVHPDERATAGAILQSILREPGESRRVRVRVLSATGEAIPCEARGNNLLHEPSIGGVVITARDVSDTVEAELSQDAIARVLELIASEAPVHEVLALIVTWVERELTDTRCTVLLTEAGAPHRVLRDGASPSMPDVYRLGVDGLSVGNRASPCAVAVGESSPVLVADLLADEQWAPMHDLARLCDVRSCWSYPIMSPASGATLGSFALYRKVPGLPEREVEPLVARASHLVGITVDRRRLLRRLAHQAQHDALTLLPNRSHLLERLTAAMESFAIGGPSPVVLFFDLDRLKVINDSLGHDVGDELLISIARRLGTAVGEGDLVARFGGDEFVVLSTRLGNKGELTTLARSLLQVISEPVALEGRLITPTASIGLVVPSVGQTATEVLRDADIAMYRAKQQGGNSFEVFGDHMRQRAFDRLDLEGQIRNGLDNGEFRVYYQPLVDLRDDDRIVGFEALVRWQHPNRGLLAPDVFLQVAEETGLIIPLGEWVLKTAVTTASQWHDEPGGDQLTISVNVAAQQLSAIGLRALVAESVQALAPWTLGLELTESTLMDNTAAVLETLDDMAAAGAQIGIDDFGTGFSSLSYLTRLPVHRLKIDRSFVADLGASKAAAAVATTIVNLAEQLEVIAIAEGIETTDQRQHLLDMGCQFGQGYLFS
jgi:diguanylate cyclase (GGDEF)-like protein/PAS domain S-box-containing protein